MKWSMAVLSWEAAVMSDTGMLDYSSVRLCNTISLLMPAYSYHINCAWTQEIPLPAIEEFTCRLLIALQEVSPREIQQYFGLSLRECEVLIETLQKNKLAAYNNDGMLIPTSMLMDRTKGSSGVSPSLTKYEVCTETVIFEALTVSIMPSTAFHRSRFGLPQLPIPDGNHSPDSQKITEIFGRQNRAFLDYSRRTEAEKRKTRLYKVEGCSTGKFVQIPIDLEVWVRPTREGDLEIIKKVAEKADGGRHRPLSMEVEARISDYLNSLTMPGVGMSIHDYCAMFNDHVLERYTDDRGLDLNHWLIDHANRRTGYGSRLTRSIIGPIYDRNNKMTIKRMLDDLSHDWNMEEIHRAFWLSSSVPLWGANGYLISDFCNDLSQHLTKERDSRGHVTAIMGYESYKDLAALKADFHTRIPNGIAYEGKGFQNQVEILLVPGQLAVVQYHAQPDRSSAITVPIGYVTVDPSRLESIESYVDKVLIGRGKPALAWSEGNTDLDKIMGDCKVQYSKTHQRVAGDTDNTGDSGGTSDSGKTDNNGNNDLHGFVEDGKVQSSKVNQRPILSLKKD